MELISFVVSILIIWFFVRLCGRVFDGPRYRRRRRNKDYRKAQQYQREAAYRWYEEQIAMRRDRRRGRW